MLRPLRSWGLAAGVFPLFIAVVFVLARAAAIDKSSIQFTRSPPDSANVSQLSQRPPSTNAQVHSAVNPRTNVIVDAPQSSNSQVEGPYSRVAEPVQQRKESNDQIVPLDAKAYGRSQSQSPANVGPSLEVNLQGVARSDQFGSYTDMQDSHANIAFFLQVASSTVLMVPRLLEKLWHEDNLIVVHLDSKIPDYQVTQLRSAYGNNQKYSNVFFMERESVTYMGISMLLNTLSAMEFLLQSGRSWDYFINLSGSDYPLVSVRDMRLLLGQPRVLRQKVTFMQLAPSKSFWTELKRSRFDLQFYDTAVGFTTDATHSLLHTNKKHPLRERVGIEFVQAEAWIIAHRSYVEKACRGNFGRKLLVLLSTMKDPEEHFFPMLAWNQHALNKTLAHHSLRAVFWHHQGRRSGQHPFVVDYQGTDGRYTFWEPMLRNAPAFFARKFTAPNSSLMDLIDKFRSGAHPEPDVESVKKSFATVRFMTQCHADIERHWNSELVVGCFRGGNLKVS